MKTAIHILAAARPESWIKLFAAIAAIAIPVFIVCVSYKYVRALVKRMSLMRSVKRVCREKGYRLEKLASCYKSVFRPTEEPELMITTPEKKLRVKFFACLKYGDTYTFENLKHYTTKSNAGMTLVNRGINPSGIAKKNYSLFLSPTHKVENEGVTEVEITGGTCVGSVEVFDGESILCVNPIPIEMRRVSGSGTEQVFDGDKFDGYTVYSGNALCGALAGA